MIDLCSPVSQVVAQKQGENMTLEAREINRMMHDLQDKIADYMERFFALGREAKRLSMKNEDPLLIAEVHQQMADLLWDIETASVLVNAMYPDPLLLELFNQLKEIKYQQLKELKEQRG